MMRSRLGRVLVYASVVAFVASAVSVPVSALAGPGNGAGGPTVRFATFNASLNRTEEGEALDDLSTPDDTQAQAVAEIIQRTRPDVLLINEFDYHRDDLLAEAFQENYLSVPQGDQDAIEYEFVFTAPSNTGVSSGFDLNNNGVTDTTPGDNAYGDDTLGFGWFPGQYGMAVFSRFPIDYEAVRTFQTFLWKDMPGAMLPDDPATAAPGDWYSPAELAIFRLSSKSHWDVPIEIGRRTVHFLVSHPTPPVFDSLEDRNGTRNNDEIRFWADYITPGPTSDYIYDDEGVTGGLEPGELFVIAGDQNSDPLDGDSVPGSIQQLLEHPLVNARVAPWSPGGAYWSDVQGLLNEGHLSDPIYDTADFCDFAGCGPGNLRADYVLPRKGIQIRGAGVFWPRPDDPGYDLTGAGFPAISSDHRLVWIDAVVPSYLGR